MARLGLVGALSILIIAILALALPCPQAQADDMVRTAEHTGDDSEPGAVIQVSYSIGQQGSRLTWLPASAEESRCQETASATPRELPRAVTSETKQVQFIAPTEALPKPLDLAPSSEGRSSAFTDPFGDATPSPRLAAQVIPPSNDTASEPLAEPLENLLLDPLDGQLPVQEPPGMPGIDEMPETPLGLNPEDVPFEEPPLNDQGLLPEIAEDDEANIDVPAFEGQSTERSDRLPPFMQPDAMAQAPEEAFRCPSPSDLKPISKITHNISAKEGDFPRECGLAPGAFVPRSWAPTTFTWTASGLCHKPAYFEDVQLERYGHSYGPLAQPVLSGAHFFLNIPILPYKMGVYPPNECIYTLGYYRPGSCSPHLLDPLPLSVRGALFQAGAVVGLAAVLP